MDFKAQLEKYAQWRKETAKSIAMYSEWCECYGLTDEQHTSELLRMLSALESERITLAFVAECSRGKTELINALFFSEMGLKLLPTQKCSVTECPPTELFYDETACYIRLLDIETRLEDTPLIEYRQKPELWTQIELNCDSPAQMQEAFKQLRAVKKVSREHAYKLGLWNEYEANKLGLLDSDELDVPCWRYALISLPHPLLKQGLCILEVSGLYSLRFEPELTLSLLPNVQAIVFALAIDTGVADSDQEIWDKHVNRVRNYAQMKFAVVMNKIDILWDDDSLDDAAYKTALASRLTHAAEKLEINEQLIFPVSVRQALAARIKPDADLLEKSRLESLDAYLSASILPLQSQLLKQSIVNDLGYLLDKSLSLSKAKYKYALDQLEEFKKIDCDNIDMMSKLLAETQEREQVYLLSVEKFQVSRRVFSVQAKTLANALSKDKVDTVIQASKEELTKVLTTYALKQKIQLLFEDLRGVLREAVDTANETQELVEVIHRKFREQYGFMDVKPKSFSFEQYQIQLEQILEEGEVFRSSLKTAMTEQTIVVKKLYGLIISRIRGVFNQANQDAAQWSDTVLLPLMRDIKDHKKQIDNRLFMLRKMNGSKEGDAENIVQLEAQLVSLKQQLTELQVINKAAKQCCLIMAS